MTFFLATNWVSKLDLSSLPDNETKYSEGKIYPFRKRFKVMNTGIPFFAMSAIFLILIFLFVITGGAGFVSLLLGLAAIPAFFIFTKDTRGLVSSPKSEFNQAVMEKFAGQNNLMIFKTDKYEDFTKIIGYYAPSDVLKRSLKTGERINNKIITGITSKVLDTPAVTVINFGSRGEDGRLKQTGMLVVDLPATNFTRTLVFAGKNNPGLGGGYLDKTLTDFSTPEQKSRGFQQYREEVSPQDLNFNAFNSLPENISALIEDNLNEEYTLLIYDNKLHIVAAWAHDLDYKPFWVNLQQNLIPNVIAPIYEYAESTK